MNGKRLATVIGLAVLTACGGDGGGGIDYNPSVDWVSRSSGSTPHEPAASGNDLPVTDGEIPSCSENSAPLRVSAILEAVWAVCDAWRCRPPPDVPPKLMPKACSREYSLEQKADDGIYAGTDRCGDIDRLVHFLKRRSECDSALPGPISGCPELLTWCIERITSSPCLSFGSGTKLELPPSCDFVTSYLSWSVDDNQQPAGAEDNTP